MLQPYPATAQLHRNVRIFSIATLTTVRPDRVRDAGEYAIDAIDLLSRGRLDIANEPDCR
jgi:hypothetical protein